MDIKPRLRSSFRENKKRYLPALAVFFLVAIFAAAGTWYAGSRDLAVERERFRVTASEAVAGLKDEAVDRKLDLDMLVHSYVIAIEQDRTDRNEYQPRLNLLFLNIGGRSGDLTRADIVLKVAAVDRSAFEANLSAETGTPVQITSIDEGGHAVRAADSADYYPVVFVEPVDLTSRYIGHNALATPALASAIKQAIISGQPAVTAPISGFSGTGKGEGYAVLAPIYAPGTQPAKGKNASVLPIGFAVGYQLYAKLLGEVNMSETGLKIYLYDSLSKNPDQPVANNLTSGVINAAGRLSMQRNDGISEIETVDQNGHIWSFVASPSRPFTVGIIFWYALFSSILFLTILAAYLLSSVKRTLELESIEAALRNANDALGATADALAHRARQLTILGEMSDALQACDSADEAFAKVSPLMPKMFEKTSGAVYFLDTSLEETKAKAKVVWGERVPVEKTVKPDTCVAMHRGGVHRFGANQRATKCQHVGEPPPAAYACIPMLAQGEPFGIFFLSSDHILVDEVYNLATTVSEHLALALKNIELRKILSEQSVTDPLTKMFNRRFMDNLFEREIRRADRGKANIGVIMIDIDHFKDINDTYGHAAGDIVLESLGVFLRTSFRMEDYVCRYGGEEFLIVLPGSNKTNTLARAENIRERAENVDYIHNGVNIGPITLSGGVSVYPGDGTDKEAVIRAADAALYAAKKAGRNCIKKAAKLKR